MTVSNVDLAAIPAEHRRTIARWLVERGDIFRPSFILSAEDTATIRDVLRGAAVDLATPTAEDSTVGHADQVLGELAGEVDQVLKAAARTELEAHIVQAGRTVARLARTVNVRRREADDRRALAELALVLTGELDVSSDPDLAGITDPSVHTSLLLAAVIMIAHREDSPS